MRPRALKCFVTFCALACFSLAVGAEDVVFAVRQPRGPHWYENFGHTINGKPAYGAGGRLCRLDLATSRVTVLLDDPGGAVRDPQVHYNGQKILFSYRKAGTPAFHLYEINVDGTGLTQLTSGAQDDLEPSYLPDGGIVFCSSRCNRYVPCWYVPVATLYRCDADGSNVTPLSSNIEQDNTPWVLPDGRILYTRWEYVDRSREHFHHLWIMNPDGTSQMAYFGNMAPGDVFLDAKPIPGSHNVVMVNSPNHGRQEHEGHIAIVTPSLGPDTPASQRIINPGTNYRDPYPVTADRFLVAQENKLLEMNAAGEAREILRLSGDLAKGGTWIHEPRLVQPRVREPVIAPRVNPRDAHGQLVVADIYHGRSMEGIQRGTIKQLLVLENLPKPVNYTGSMDPISYGGSYTLNRVLGTVPVEPDGSVNARVPALRSLQLVALDEHDLSVKRMHSFLTVMPGEVTSCTGCHENRGEAPPSASAVLATRRAPSFIQAIPGAPEIFDYPRDIQPIWDQHCLKCHDTDKYDGRALLTGDAGPMFTHSYFTLSVRLQVADGRDLARGNYPPYSIGSSSSYLMDKLIPSHYNVKLSARELRMVKLWIDASATFPGTYAALGSGMIGPYAALQYGTKPKIDWLSRPATKEARQVMQRRCGSCHTGRMTLPATPADDLDFRLHHLEYNGGKPRFWEPPWLVKSNDERPGSVEWMKRHADPRLQFSRHILYNLTRPEKSLLLLAPLSKEAGGMGSCGAVFSSPTDTDYIAMLEGIREAQRHLESITRFTMVNFQPEPEYIKEMQRYGVLSAERKPGETVNVYDVDRRYWEAQWYRPMRSPK